jgi:hypothetical protein
MAISTKANSLDEVEQAFVAMGTEMNKGVLGNLGLFTPELEAAGSGDLMVVLEAREGADADESSRGSRSSSSARRPPRARRPSPTGPSRPPRRTTRPPTSR